MNENLNAQQLPDAQLENAAGGAGFNGKQVTVKCGKCGKKLKVTYGMSVKCPDPGCRWVTTFSPDIIVKD
ncbi:MAG: hypothetical protein K6F80_03550 [Oscillospiraceae bacterium]|nr:hypothetical protein [Oscillospiraceae bacterium]